MTVVDTTIRHSRDKPVWRYLSLARTTLQQAIAYRITTFFNVGLTFIWVIILYYLWRAAYAGRGSIAGLSWDEMRTYVVIAYGLNALVGWRTGTAMMATIRTGDVVFDMVRPLNYCGTQIARALGFTAVEGAISMIFTLVIGLLFLDIRPPSSIGAGLLFAVALIIGFLTKVLVVFGVSLLTFWTLNGMGLMWSQQAIMQILSGTIVPLALMPSWLQVIAGVLPLRGIVSTPLQLYLGKSSGWDAAGLIGLQLVWLVVLWALANLAWRRAFRAVEIQGG
ncbi:ABC transporter permease [Microlunatus soli]|uniref:ABC-2 type transport system permease protein n=1 Tax=Microlunatus soli TaxID=630515 RepID=A0A1H1WYJ6_9ACTN|nr:ABC-2 family transporter protein [Microlunatus soli]SDT02155.1 ABC-2 type transport system permease protein [Microlunatus soli]